MNRCTDEPLIRASKGSVAAKHCIQLIAASRLLQVTHMVQFTAFDPATRAAAQAATHAEVALSRGDVLSVVLERENAVAILPAGEGAAFLVTVRKRAPRPVAQTAPAPLDVARWQSPEAVSYSAGGFLGLLDEPVYEEKPKSWWRKVLG